MRPMVISAATPQPKEMSGDFPALPQLTDAITNAAPSRKFLKLEKLSQVMVFDYFPAVQLFK